MMVTLRRYWLQLTADKKKFTVLCVMIGLGLLLWARLIVISNMPRTAVAEEEASASASTTPATDAPHVSDNRGGVAIPVALAERPERDPFMISAAHFPKPAPVNDLASEAEKSSSQQAEDPEAAEARLRARLQGLVDQLTLEAAMTGASLAVIDGATYRTGSSVPAGGDEQVTFLLEEVRQRSVVLVYEGRRFQLKMSRPGG
ncbi:MAG: hypothetical protein SYC29_07050 [Planctomycetota bacterium]|nr:hypothetical protein [Planctomycetota bacterium]